MFQKDNCESAVSTFLKLLAQNQTFYGMFISALELCEKAENEKLNQMAAAALLDESKKPLAIMQLGKVQAIHDALLHAQRIQ